MCCSHGEFTHLAATPFITEGQWNTVIEVPIGCGTYRTNLMCPHGQKAQAALKLGWCFNCIIYGRYRTQSQYWYSFSVIYTGTSFYSKMSRSLTTSKWGRSSITIAPFPSMTSWSNWHPPTGPRAIARATATAHRLTARTRKTVTWSTEIRLDHSGTSFRWILMGLCSLRCLTRFATAYCWTGGMKGREGPTKEGPINHSSWQLTIWILFIVVSVA